MLEGSCLCGGIRYQYHGDITEIAMCHCGQCRRGQGTGFVTNSPVERARFQLRDGAELIREYRASPLKVRTFCGQCGSPLYSARDDLPEIIRLRLGTVTTPFSCEQRYHIFVESKADWVTINDDYPQFARMKP